jgi:hypothetical protein
MNLANRVVSEGQEDEIPQLQVVKAKNSIRKASKPSAPLVLPLSLHQRPPRPELATLGWSDRAIRLTGGGK